MGPKSGPTTSCWRPGIWRWPASGASPGGRTRLLLLLGRSLCLAGHVAESLPILEQALEELPTKPRKSIDCSARPIVKGPSPTCTEPWSTIGNSWPTRTCRSAIARRACSMRPSCTGSSTISPPAPRPSTASRPTHSSVRGRAAPRSDRTAGCPRGEKPAHAADPGRRPPGRQQLYDDTIKLLRKAQDDPLADRAIRQSMYLIGVCLLETGDVARAEQAQFERTRDLYRDSPEGIAAGLQVADLLLAAEARRAGAGGLRRMLAAIPETPSSAIPGFRRPSFAAESWPLISISSTRRSTRTAWAHRVDVPAISPDPVRPPGGRDLSLLGPQPAARSRSCRIRSDEMRAKARAQYRKAGQVFGQLAELEFTTRNYPDDVWQAAGSYLAGHRFSQAVSAVGRISEIRTPPPSRWRWSIWARPLSALGRIDDALVALGECIESIRRRGQLSGPAVGGPGQDRRKRRRRRCRGPVAGEPQRQAAHARQQGMARLAVHRLASCWPPPAARPKRSSGWKKPWPGIPTRGNRSKPVTSSPSVASRRPRCRKRRLRPTPSRRLGSASQAGAAVPGNCHQLLRADARGAQPPPGADRAEPLEKLLFAQFVFRGRSRAGRTGTRRRRDPAYSTATNRYQHDPEALEAFAQIATCYRRLNKAREARGTIQQAKAVLERIDPNASFAEATIYSRREWKELLDWMGKL